MSIVKERILGALVIMSEEQAQRLWKMLENEFSDDWSGIEEVDPDEIDLKMLSDIENDPDCKVFVAAEDVYKELGI